MAMRRGVACSLLLFLVAVTHAFVRPAAPSSIQVRKQQHPGAPRGPPENSGLKPLQAKGSGPEFGRKQAKRDLMERQRAMAEFNAEIETTPVFQVFAATQKMKGLWMPVAAFKADNVAKGVVDASLQEGIAANMFKGVYKAQVETAVSKAIFDNERRLREQGQAMHATLKNAPRDQIIWGFKILYKPLQDKFGKTQQPTVVTKDMSKSLFDKFKDSVSNKVQETFSLKLEEPAPTTPTPPPAGGGKKKKGGKKDKSGAAASAASE
ncbi:hypothetical protein NSK_002202 [Nannochloropsis salina CCMP1776]|uniref:Uncharacterized protein n=1 Tax=Nannochloropsis salina CCMP1776 TaxID=1027361 RepID=A0A4D9DAR2_9STRA|nr:hypothetical protein NSK_002202 [Nannochloropsis salina CCMP1776]|eukprot:TFJ86545.1 hypothetical protein NSK_002202 [Nannochloropsis salina CCMP1776]